VPDQTHLKLLLQAMVKIGYYTFLILCFSLLIHSRVFHRPLLLDDEFMAMLESYATDDHHRTTPATEEENILDQLDKDYEIGKAIKSHFHINLHLPRYLRQID